MSADGPPPPGTARAPAGVRPVGGGGRLRWVEPGAFELAIGDRVAVREDDEAWLGEVVVPPDRLVEWPAPELSRMPVVVRRAADDEWPAPPGTDGRRLLDSLGLPPDVLARPRAGSAPGPLVLHAGSGPGDPTEDERADQERGGDQREPE